ncbi:MAG: hypothetical protein KKG47_14945 [Proteobacteria bacterium]|nr:hypothetical protein [Pseudomonadota bacterium]MBU1738837.1 hypothetical protein [Pseudomonadota bacterium]
MNRIVRPHLACAVLSLSLLIPSWSRAAEINIVSDSLLRSYERDTSAKTNIAVMPLYEFLQVESGSLTKPGLSFHAYGWGRSDLGDRAFFTDNESGELLYGYFEYTSDHRDFNTRLGRQNIFGGPTNEVVDGVSLGGEIVPNLGLMVFGGLPVSLTEENGVGGDLAYGGKLSYSFPGKHRLAVSYRMIESNSTRDDEVVGLDLFLVLPKDVDLSGMSTRSLVTDDWREHLYEARFSLDEVVVRPYFQQLQYADLFNSNTNSANPFRYLAGTGEKLATAGFDLSWMGMEGWEFGAKSKYHSFSVRTDDAYYVSALATWHSEEMSMVGIEAGVMDGDDPRDEYLLARLFCYWDEIPFSLPIGFVTGDLIYADYGRQINNKGDSLFLSVGGGKKFLDGALEVKLAGDYASDPYYKEDYRSTLVVTYRYAVINEDE